MILLNCLFAPGCYQHVIYREAWDASSSALSFHATNKRVSFDNDKNVVMSVCNWQKYARKTIVLVSALGAITSPSVCLVIWGAFHRAIKLQGGRRRGGTHCNTSLAVLPSPRWQTLQLWMLSYILTNIGLSIVEKGNACVDALCARFVQWICGYHWFHSFAMLHNNTNPFSESYRTV